MVELRHAGLGAAVRLTTPKGEYDLDFVIVSTGFGVDLSRRPELAAIAPHIQMWGDRYAPPLAEESVPLAASPDLRPYFEFREKTPGACPVLGSVYCFNFPANLSHGKLSGDMPAVREGAEDRAEPLFTEERAWHYEALLAYDTPGLLGDEWRDADLGVEGLDMSVRTLPAPLIHAPR